LILNAETYVEKFMFENSPSPPGGWHYGYCSTNILHCVAWGVALRLL